MPENNNDILRQGFLEVSQVAKRLGVSASTIYRMIDEGLLPAIRIRKTIKIPTVAVNEYLQRQIERL